MPIVSDERLASLCKLLESRIQDQSVTKKTRYIPIGQVLALVGIVGVVGITVVAPPAGAVIGKLVVDALKERDKKESRKYNVYFLNRALERLHDQKMVTIDEDYGVWRIALTDQGRYRVLKYALHELYIPAPKQWDGYWRIIVYDVEEGKKKLRDAFRSALKNLGFLKLQGSTWLYPYPCDEQIAFLREFYGVGNEVLYIVAKRLEDDLPYREYFDLS